MKLLVILISLAVQRWLNIESIQPGFGWYNAYLQRCKSFLSGDNDWMLSLKLLLLILPFLIVLGLILFLVKGWLLGMISILVGVLVLLYCMPALDSERQFTPFIEALQDSDDSRVAKEAKRILNKTPPKEPEKLCHAVMTAMFQIPARQTFPIIFWFLVLGPVGALLYRLLELTTHSKLKAVQAASVPLEALMAWLPSRLLAFSFALVGNFIAVFKRFVGFLSSGLSDNEAVLTESGYLAIGLSDDDSKIIQAEKYTMAMQLIQHSLLVWIAIVVMLSLTALIN